MLAHEPTWLAELAPPTRHAGDRNPSVIELAAEGERALRLRIDLGNDGPDRPSLVRRDRCALLLDGFLHDRARLARAMSGSTGAETDAELLLAAFLELGERMLPLLRGSFALVAWDGRHGSIVCTRDLTGSHPLFFSRDGERVLVSSSQGALLEVGKVPGEFDRLAIARWVMTGSALPRRTFYRLIQRLPPGYVLRAAAGEARLWRYWHPGDGAAAEDQSPEEAVEQFEELLDQAVVRSASLGRLGIFLSGGVDSAAVTASAAVVSRARSLADPVALSYVYPDPEASEEATQRTVASVLGIPLRIVPLHETVGPDGLLAAAMRLTGRAWMPCVNPWEPATVYLAAEGAELGCRAILSGEGGNDWFEVERYEAADLLRRLKLLELARLWSQERRAGRPGLDTARTLLWENGSRVLLRQCALAAGGRVAPGRLEAVRRRRVLSWTPEGWFLPDTSLRSALADEWLRNRDVDRPSDFRASARERRLDSVHLVVPVENRFLFGRRIGVHFANPAVDPDLVEFLFGLPRALLNLGGRGKGLARETVRRRAGETAAPALGFAWLEQYFGALLRAEGARALEAVSGLRRLSELGIVDENAFRKGLRGAGLGREVSYYQAWQTLACEAWLQSRA
jgi:hypothetical protein